MTPGEILPFPADEAQSIERIAAQWLVRRQEGLTPAEQRQLEVWLESDPRHERVYSEMQDTSELLDQLRKPEWAVPPAPVPGDRLAFVRRPRWLIPVFAAAAAFVIGWFLWPRPAASGAVFETIVTTEIGAVRELRLPDGSVVQLNTASAAVVRFTATERRVHLTQGEAYFIVAKNPERPFWVEAGTVGVRAVGTAFNVRRRDQVVDVLVTEGKVRIAGSSRQAGTPPPAAHIDRLLDAGERLSVAVGIEAAASPLPTVVSREEINRTLAWRQQRLEFDRMPLAEVVAEFNRHNRHQLVIADPELAAQHFGGAFSPQGSDAFIEILEQSFGVRAERRGAVTILRKADR